MTATAQHLIALSGLSRRQVARAVGCTERALADNEQVRRHQDRITLLTAVIEPLAATAEGRRAVLLASSSGPSLFHQLVAEVPRGQVIQVAIPVRERLGI